MVGMLVAALVVSTVPARAMAQTVRVGAGATVIPAVALMAGALTGVTPLPSPLASSFPLASPFPVLTATPGLQLPAVPTFIVAPAAAIPAALSAGLAPLIGAAVAADVSEATAHVSARAMFAEGAGGGEVSAPSAQEAASARGPLAIGEVVALRDGSISVVGRIVTLFKDGTVELSVSPGKYDAGPQRMFSTRENLFRRLDSSGGYRPGIVVVHRENEADSYQMPLMITMVFEGGYYAAEGDRHAWRFLARDVLLRPILTIQYGTRVAVMENGKPEYGTTVGMTSEGKFVVRGDINEDRFMRALAPKEVGTLVTDLEYLPVKFGMILNIGGDQGPLTRVYSNGVVVIDAWRHTVPDRAVTLVSGFRHDVAEAFEKRQRASAPVASLAAETAGDVLP